MTSDAEPVTGLVVDSLLQLCPQERSGSVGDDLVRGVRGLASAGVALIVVRDDYRPGGPDGDIPRLDPFLTAAHLARSVPGGPAIVIASDVALYEPFHLAKNLQSLDHATAGRVGWLPRPGARPESLALVAAARAPADPDAHLVELLDVVTGLWDTWEEGAIVRDVVGGRYLDPERVHFLHHQGEHFSVRGPSLVPRSPQGRIPLFAFEDAPAALAALAEVVLVADGEGRWSAMVADARRAALFEVVGCGPGAIESALRQRTGSGTEPLRGCTLRTLLGLPPAAAHRAQEELVTHG